jgi:uncharacterized protein (TIGR00303 family)
MTVSKMAVPYSIINSPHGALERLFERIKTARSPLFLMCVGGTKTSDLVGLSGAGATPEDRRQTPKCDAEALVNGLAGRTSRLPVSPEGIVSPVVISTACLKSLSIPIKIIDCGTFSAPVDGEVITVGTPPANCLSDGFAQVPGDVERLFQTGLELGEQFARSHDLVIIAECVPAGTTTAFAVLTGLGYDVHGAVSSSMPNFNHQMRWQLATTGLTKAGLMSAVVAGDPEETLRRLETPLKVVAAVGDPMQPFAGGLALAASNKAAVIMGGGSQMLTVYALAQACAASGITHNRENIGIVTTSWVAFDKNAKVGEISKAVNAPFGCSLLDFSKSIHNGLRAYEEGHVKEGVGAGASIVLAHLLGKLTESELIASIDETYTRMVTGKTMSGSSPS